MMHDILINPREIEELLLSYVAIPSQTGTPKEEAAAQFVSDYFGRLDYFRRHPDHYGLAEVSGDTLGRKIAWALVKGRGPDTLVMVHHYDVVGVEDFLEIKDLAFDPKSLMAELARTPHRLNPEAQKDLASGQWLFGRGTADMKSGGAIQMVLVKKLSELEGFTGNVVMIAVPDEENASAGMRSATLLLDQIKEQHHLDYLCMLNTEPHQRKEASVGIVSGGSVGKFLPFVYVRGVLAHAGKSPEGFNPLQILAEIVTRTEMNPLFGEESPETGELAPPPTWLMVRDSKDQYDVSMPLSAYGCLSILTLSNEPDRWLQQLMDVAKEAAELKAQQVNASVSRYAKKTNRALAYERWSPRVVAFSDLLIEGECKLGDRFLRIYQETLRSAEDELGSGAIDYAQVTWRLVDTLVDALSPSSPMVVIGVQPPYYPSVSFYDRYEHRQRIEGIFHKLSAYSNKSFRQSYELEAYFTGISDLSYASLDESEVELMENNVAKQMPLYGQGYFIPFATIAKNAMPCINIGPWGKDFHKISERVLKEDAFRQTPMLILHMIRQLFEAVPPEEGIDIKEEYYV